MRNLPLVRIAVAATLLSGLFPTLSAQEVLEGTLFTSPEQRAYLDYLRKDFLARSKDSGFNIDSSDVPDIPVDSATSPAGPTEYTLGGIMRRSDGHLTIWLNNRSLTESELPDIARLVRDGNTLALRFTTANGTQLLRPGQTIEVNSGAVQERYQRPKQDSEPPVKNSATSEEDATDDQEAQKTLNEAADAAESTVSSTSADETPEDSGTVASPDTVADSLPAEILEDPEALESVIESLQAKRNSLSEAEDTDE